MDNLKNPSAVERVDYIKPYAIVKLGYKVASLIAAGYNSASAEDKLVFVKNVLSLSEEDLAAPAKVKFIGDVMTRPKKERLKIATKILLLLEEGANKVEE